MVSNLKRYRSQISLITKAITKRLESTAGYNVMRDNTRVQRVLASNFQGQLYGATFHIVLTWDCLKLKAVEEAGKIYIGVDLTQTPLARFGRDRTQGADTYIWDVMYWYIKDASPELEADLGYSKYTVLNDQKLFYQSKAYEKIIKLTDSAMSDFTCLTVLKSGEWPTLKDRSILPVAVLDFDKDQITFIRNSTVTSYRKDNNTTFIGSFAEHANDALNGLYVPRPLFDGQYRNKYTGAINF